MFTIKENVGFWSSLCRLLMMISDDDDDDVYSYTWLALKRPRRDIFSVSPSRRKLEGETENMGVCTKERKGVRERETLVCIRKTAARHERGE